MELVINNDLLKKCGNGSSEYWFSYKTYNIFNIYDFKRGLDDPKNANESYFLSLGFIPFVSVSNEEMMRAFVTKTGKKKLIKAVESDGGDYVESFWKYFKAYPELEDGFVDFEKSYVRDKIIDWCAENDISYKIDIK